MCIIGMKRVVSVAVFSDFKFIFLNLLLLAVSSFRALSSYERRQVVEHDKFHSE